MKRLIDRSRVRGRVISGGSLLTLLTTMTMSLAADTDNPLLGEWKTPFQVPPFQLIREDHFLPAFREAMAAQIAEVEAIASSGARPDFANTIEGLERTGERLTRVNSVFSNLCSAETNDRLQALAKEVAPMLAAHHDAILLNERLFARVKAVWKERSELGLAPEQATLLEKTWKRFVRGGALLGSAEKERLRAINAELASLGVRFGDNLLKEMNAYRLVLDRSDLAGLPEREVAAAAAAGRKAGLEEKYLFTLHAPSLWPFLQYSERRDLRQEMFQAYITRGNRDDATDNKAVASRLAALRLEKAGLLGYSTWADYVLEESMARTPERVYDLLNRLWPAAKRVAAAETEAFQSVIRAEGGTFELQPWDWFYYAERVRRERYDLDENELRPYFRLENVRDGAFAVATELFGLTFSPVAEIPVYHPEVQAFEVRDGDGSHLALLYLDFHPRPGKRSGAWASHYRSSHQRDGERIPPVVVNVCNFSRPSGDAPALLSLEEVETLFHEFGHALHGMLSRVRYRSLNSTPRDFVELPSQIMENWATEPAVLKRYARHWRTGAPIPDTLIEKMRKADQFNQGFKTVEYLAASFLDLDWHTLVQPGEAGAMQVERLSLARMSMPPQIVPRYRSTYFQHIFAGGYSAGYYSYIWAEVLDADAFEAFKERGLFDRETATSFRRNILEKGQSEDPALLYERFRGRGPQVEPLLQRRGLMPAS
jgi:peptidyl-dipeptidase Dcp